MNSMKNDSLQPLVNEEKEVKAVGVSFANVDSKVTASVKTMADHYLQIKNALVNDNGVEAVNGAKALENAVSKLDKSLLTPEQKGAYDKK
jgi:hypothetical protein